MTKMKKINKIEEVNPVPEEKFINDLAKKKKEQEEYLKRVEEDFEKGILNLFDYSGVKIFKSIRRAIKRGHASIYGAVFPKRPFSNKKETKKGVTYKKRRIYEQLTHKNRRCN